ncbi:MAG TPA: MFS transporter [Candidatus Limnocylindria bacterium]|nr:MFS transporter [Candidatus Limnocylindria bacterium]
MRTFHLLVGNTLVASITSNFLWFALTFWVYLETRSVVATAIIGGGYLLLISVSGMFFGTFVDRHIRRTSMLLSSAISVVAFALAGAVYAVAPAAGLRDIAHPAFWALIVLVLVGAVAGNLRMVALSTTVTLLVPEERRARANGLVGTANGVVFATTSVLSGFAIGFLGMGWSVAIATVVTALAAAHLFTIRIAEEAPQPHEDSPRFIDLGGALRAVRVVPGLLALLFFSTFNNFLGGVFTALLDPYGLSLMSVEVYGIVLAITSSGFIIGGILVARRGLGANPVRTLLLSNVVMWTVTILFPIRFEVLPLIIGFFTYLVLAPIAEASEQTIIQKVVPFEEQGRVFGFAQTVEAAAAPVTAFMIGPIAQFWVLPSMTDGALADLIGPWFGTGPERGLALIFIIAAIIGLTVTLIALRSRPYRRLSDRYIAAPVEPAGAGHAPSKVSSDAPSAS